MTEDKLLDLTVTFAPQAQSPNQNVVYNNVVHWEWDSGLGLRIQLEDDVAVLFNPMFILAVMEKPALEPEQAELWDVDDDNEE